MGREVLEVEFRPDGQRPQRGGRRGVWGDIVWSVIGAAALVLLVLLAIELLPFLLVILVVAAVLAGLSTWKAARRRRILMQYGWPASRVEVKTYFAYLAGWFIGLLVFLPLLVFGAMAAVLILAFVGVFLVAAMIAGLFRA